MAIALDTSATAAATPASPWSYSYTITGANPILFVGLVIDSSATVSGVNWNTSEAMTLLDSVAISATELLYLFVLANPTTGTHNVTVTFTGSPNLSHFTASYTGASSGAIDAHKSDQQTAQNVTVSLTTIAASCWMVFLTRDIGADTTNLTSGGTIRQSSGTHTRFGDTNGAVSAGSNSFVFNQPAGSEQLSTLVASFAPVAAAADTLWAASCM